MAADTEIGILMANTGPNAAHAAASAAGRNLLSFFVPCHRVLGKTGGLCGCHWELTRKCAILGCGTPGLPASA